MCIYISLCFVLWCLYHSFYVCTYNLFTHNNQDCVTGTWKYSYCPNANGVSRHQSTTKYTKPWDARIFLGMNFVGCKVIFGQIVPEDECSEMVSIVIFLKTCSFTRPIKVTLWVRDSWNIYWIDLISRIPNLTSQFNGICIEKTLLVYIHVCHRVSINGFTWQLSTVMCI